MIIVNSQIHSSRFVGESDRWLTCLTSYLLSNSRTSSLTPHNLSSVSVQSLPPATLRYIRQADGSPNLCHIVDCAEWCLVIIAWSAGIEQVSISARSLDICCLALLTGEGLGEVLVNWKRGCEEYMRVRVLN